MRAGCVCRVCEPGAGRPCHNWNGQALCGGVHREEIYGNTRKGEGEWERGRKGDNGPRGMWRRWGEESSLRVNIARSWERYEVSMEKWAWWSTRMLTHGCLVNAHSSFMGCLLNSPMTLTWIMGYCRLYVQYTNDKFSWVQFFTLDSFNRSKKANLKSVTVCFLRHLSFLFWWAVFSTPSFSLTVLDYSCKSPQLPSRQAFSMKAGEALKGRREGAGEGSTEEPCTSETLEELGLKAMEILGG